MAISPRAAAAPGLHRTKVARSRIDADGFVDLEFANGRGDELGDDAYRHAMVHNDGGLGSSQPPRSWLGQGDGSSLVRRRRRHARTSMF